LKEYEAEVKDGGILIGLNPKSDEDARRFQNEWNTPVIAGA
jgi:hypothetical protein